MNYVGALQEREARYGRSEPQYFTVNSISIENAFHFKCRVVLESGKAFETDGYCTSINKANQSAAEQALSVSAQKQDEMRRARAIVYRVLASIDSTEFVTMTVTPDIRARVCSALGGIGVAYKTTNDGMLRFTRK